MAKSGKVLSASAVFGFRLLLVRFGVECLGVWGLGSLKVEVLGVLGLGSFFRKSLGTLGPWFHGLLYSFLGLGRKPRSEVSSGLDFGVYCHGSLGLCLTDTGCSEDEV